MKFNVRISQPGYNNVDFTFEDFGDATTLLALLRKDTMHETTISIRVGEIKLNQQEEDEGIKEE